MKKIFIFIAFGLVSCNSTYDLGPDPNVSFTQRELQARNIKVENLPGLYVSFPQPATFYKDSRRNQTQDVSGGILFIENLITGASLYQPKEVAVRYNEGPKKGEVVKGPLRTDKLSLASGEILTEDFLAQIVGAIPGEGDEYLSEVLVEVKSDSLGDVFSYVPIPVFSRSAYRGTTNDTRNGFTPFKELRTSGNQENLSGNKKARDYRYTIKLLVFQEDMSLEPQFKVEGGTNLVFFEENNVRYYVTQGKSGNWWFLSETSKFLYIDKFYLVETTNNQKTQSEAESKKIGQ